MALAVKSLSVNPLQVRLFKRMGISVLINTLNEEVRIKACIDSLTWADEIVMVGMLSDDSTAKVASQMGFKVFSHPRMGFVEPARQFGIDQTTNEWVLILDADDMVSVETPKRLREIADGGVFSAVLLPRKNYWNGLFLKCCGCFGSASVGKSGLERYGVGGLVLSFDFSLVPGLGEFLVTVGKDGLFFAEKFVLRGDVSDGGV
jgi:glycosyltransferase involved in cell wall biosynthesis